MNELQGYTEDAIILDVVDKGIKVIKQVEVISELDKAGALLIEKVGGKVAYKLRSPKEKREDALIFVEKAGMVVRENLPESAAALDHTLARLIVFAGEAAQDLLAKIKENAATLHGSKVKAGRFEGCRIVYAGKSSYIELGDDLLLYLTPDCVESVSFSHKKYRVKKLANYYYYNIRFRDGSESFVRVSEKHRENLEHCNLQAGTITIFEELPPGEADKNEA